MSTIATIKTKWHVIKTCKGCNELEKAIKDMESDGYVVAGLSEDNLKYFIVIFRSAKL